MGIENLIERGACSVNGEPARAGLHLSAGDTVEVEASDVPPNSMTPDPMALEVVHEDEHLIVLVKPAGVLVHPTRGVKRGTLANALAYHFNRFRTAEFIRPGINAASLALNPSNVIKPRSSQPCVSMVQERTGVCHGAGCRQCAGPAEWVP